MAEEPHAEAQRQPARASHTVYLGLGSNLGDRDAYLRTAIKALAPAVVVERLSSVYDTTPQLVTEQPRFHNIVCLGRTTLAPSELLHTVKSIEARLGRTPGLRYGPRVIDIDILFYDHLVMQSPELTLPHPRIAERAFVLVPLAEIAPHLRHPTIDLPMAEMARLAPADGIVNLGPLFPSVS